MAMRLRVGVALDRNGRRTPIRPRAGTYRPHIIPEGSSSMLGVQFVSGPEFLTVWRDYIPVGPPYILSGDEEALKATVDKVVHRGWQQYLVSGDLDLAEDRRLHLGLHPQPFHGPIGADADAAKTWVAEFEQRAREVRSGSTASGTGSWSMHGSRSAGVTDRLGASSIAMAAGGHSRNALARSHRIA